MTQLFKPFVALMLSAAVLSVAQAAETTTTLTTVGAAVEETTFGDLTADALCAVAGTTVALVPALVFREGEIPPGEVSSQAVRSLLYEPEEHWAVLELTGAQLRAALERAVSFAPSSPRVYFLQVSGLVVVYDPRAPRGHKLRAVSVAGAELSDVAKYEVAMPESLADGGAGYFGIFGEAPRVRTGNQGMADLIMDFVRNRGTVSYSGQGRVVVGG